jgi:hypothetical protein
MVHATLYAKYILGRHKWKMISSNGVHVNFSDIPRKEYTSVLRLMHNMNTDQKPTFLVYRVSVYIRGVHSG